MKGPARRRFGNARGSAVSLRSLPQNELVQCQIRHRFTQTTIPELNLLQALHLLDLQLAELPPPRTISHFNQPDLADRPDTFCPCETGTFDLPQASRRSLRACYRFLPFVVLLDEHKYPKSDHFQQLDKCGIRKDRQDIINSDIGAQE
jgi:hypothetical protein